jgi:hypothetical protein
MTRRCCCLVMRLRWWRPCLSGVRASQLHAPGPRGRVPNGTGPVDRIVCSWKAAAREFLPKKGFLRQKVMRGSRGSFAQKGLFEAKGGGGSGFRVHGIGGVFLSGFGQLAATAGGDPPAGRCLAWARSARANCARWASRPRSTCARSRCRSSSSASATASALFSSRRAAARRARRRARALPCTLLRFLHGLGVLSPHFCARFRYTFSIWGPISPISVHGVLLGWTRAPFPPPQQRGPAVSSESNVMVCGGSSQWDAH